MQEKKNAPRERGADERQGVISCIFTRMKRICKKDPTTFWLSMYSFVTGNVALLLALWRLFRLLLHK